MFLLFKEIASVIGSHFPRNHPQPPTLHSWLLLLQAIPVPSAFLVHKEPSQAYNELQTQCFGLKFVEIGKVMLTWGILKNVSQVVQRVVFLHEDLMKLPSFPRKALEAELDLHANGEIGKVSPRLLIRQQNFLPFFANQNWLYQALFLNSWTMQILLPGAGSLDNVPNFVLVVISTKN